MTRLVTFLSALVLCASGLSAAGELFPRDSLAYIEVPEGEPVRRFIDLENLKAIDLHLRDEDDFKKATDLIRKSTDDLLSLEAAIVGIKLYRDREPIPQLVARARYAREWTLEDAFDVVHGGETREPMAVMNHQGVGYFHIENDRDAPVVGVLGKDLLLSLESSHLFDMIDAAQGKTSEEELLPANAGFTAWKGSATGAIRGWCNVEKLKAAVDRFAPKGRTRTIYSEDKEGKEVRREVQRIDGFFTMIEGMQALEWDKIASISFSSGIEEGAKIKAVATLKESLSYQDSLPKPTTFEMIKYLPKTTYMAGAFGLPKPSQVADTGLELLKKARKAALAKYPKALDGRFIDGSSAFRSTDVLMNSRDLMQVAGRRIASAMRKAGMSSSWSGDVKTVYKRLNDATLLEPIGDFLLTRVEGLHSNEDGELRGSFEFAYGAGKKLRYNFEDNKFVDLHGNEFEEDDSVHLTEAQTLGGFQGMLEFALGISSGELDGVIGDHAIIGGAADLLGGVVDRPRQIVHEDGVFTIIAVKDAKKLDTLALRAGQGYEEDDRTFLLNRSDTGFRPDPALGGGKIMYSDRDFVMVLAEDALLIGAPGIVAQCFEQQRPTRIMKELGDAPKASGLFVADFLAMRTPEHAEEWPIYKYQSYSNYDFVHSLSFNFEPKQITLEAGQPFGKLADLIKLEAPYGRRPQEDGSTIHELRSAAQWIFESRLADDDKENDKIPTLKEMVENYKDHLKHLEADEESPHHYFDETYLDDDFEESRMFEGKLQDNWEFLPAFTDFEQSELPSELAGGVPIAVSKKKFDGRNAVIAGGWGDVNLLNDQRFRSLQSALKSPKADIPRPSLTKAQAALALGPSWGISGLSNWKWYAEAKGESEVAEFFDGTTAKRTLSNGQTVLTRFEGFGHWAVFNAEDRLVGASWWKKSEEESKD